MASEVLATLNEPFWGEHKAYMRKHSAAVNHQPLIHNPNPNPSFNLTRQIQGHFGNNGVHFDRSPSPERPCTVSGEGYGGYSTIKFGEFSKKDLKALKRRLVRELDQVRSLRTWIESNEFSRTGNPKSSKLSGSKRVNPFESVKDPKRVADEPMEKLNLGIMKKCALILGKLKKHRFGWVFNNPVDVEGLGLVDYYQVITHPMDLGTVEVNLNGGVYASALDFASDVRLTFNNAMRYNPKGQDVHMMAGKLLKIFDDLFEPAYVKFQKDVKKVSVKGEPMQSGFCREPVRVINEGFRRGNDSFPVSRISSDDTVGVARKMGTGNVAMAKKLGTDIVAIAKKSSTDNVAVAKKSSTDNVAIAKKSSSDIMEVGRESDMMRKDSIMSNHVAPLPAQMQSSKTLVTPRKLPKPKAKDPNKRDMTFEEKARLGMSLQELPEEKMVHLLHIIKKRNQQLSHDGDEIELDIEAVDTETLWELDRFVTNYKKMISKIRRQGLIQNQILPDHLNMSPVSETPEAPQMSKKVDAGEEDVDIGEDMPMSSFPPVEIEKDATGAASSGSSSSSSSSSSGSSSSDSESGSSSGSDSDADSVQSPFVESKQGNGA